MSAYTRNPRRTWAAAAGTLTALLVLAGCGDLFTVENPGLIEDAALDDPGVIPAMVTGISGEFAQAMNTVTGRVAEMSFELVDGGPTIAEHNIGVLNPDITDAWWTAMQRARWVAESGVVRIKNLTPAADYARSAYAARANLFAGFANRLLGENVCNAVIDGGKAEAREVHFKRAEDYFTAAAQIAQAAGSTAQDIYLASLAGRASVRAWQGNWSGATADASLVPASFVYKALFANTTAREQNAFFNPTFRQFYQTVAGTPWLAPKDARTPYQPVLDSKGVQIKTRDGRWPMYAQMKYPALDSDIPITSGVEMLLLRAEAALRAKDLAGATTQMNANRAQFKMGAVTAPTTEAAAWELLKFERGATLWLEARRFWDLARWFKDGRDKAMEGRALCMPIGRTEITTNPNLTEFR